MNSYVIISIICLMPSLLNSMDPHQLMNAALNGALRDSPLNQERLSAAQAALTLQQPRNKKPRNKIHPSTVTSATIAPQREGQR